MSDITATDAATPEVPVMDGVESSYVDTPRLRQHVLACGPHGGEPIVFLHGNFSAATYWEELMLTLARDGYRCIAPDLRGYGWTEDVVIDATQGFRTWAEDVNALLEALDVPRAHFVGWSMGAGVIYRFVADHADKVFSVVLQSPVSPYGFGGTKDVDGTPCFDDFAGSGGGVVNRDFVERIRQGDRSSDDPNSPRNVIQAFYYKAPFKPAREEAFLTAALMEKVGDDRYPGDFVPSPNWPNVAPGVLGPVNCWSPKYLRNEVADFLAAEPRPRVLWIHGDSDLIVGDNSMFDLATLGSLGYVPGWPGADVVPPQPMVGQVRAVLERYQDAGGEYQEVLLADCGHAPHIEKPIEWLGAFRAHLAS